MPKRTVLALRNPSDKPQTFDVDTGAALQLPDGAARTWYATTRFGDDGTRTFTAGKSEAVMLQPFQVVVWALAPWFA